MTKIVVVHHAHHKDEHVYRLVYATQFEEPVQVPNPDYEPDNPDTSPTIEDVVITHVDHQEIVWDADDPQWRKLRSRTKIASEQRRIVSEMLTRRAAERERSEIEHADAAIDLGAGDEL